MPSRRPSPVLVPMYCHCCCCLWQVWSAPLQDTVASPCRERSGWVCPISGTLRSGAGQHPRIYPPRGAPLEDCPPAHLVRELWAGRDGFFPRIRWRKTAGWDEYFPTDRSVSVNDPTTIRTQKRKLSTINENDPRHSTSYSQRAFSSPALP